MGVYRNDLGSFASETLALADVLNKGWDSGGNPQEGMFFYDTATLQVKTYLNGVWNAQGNAGEVAALGITQSGQPVADETVIIGGDTYTFKAAKTVAFEVEISAVNAEGTLDNLLAEAVAQGTENLLWEKLSATQLRLSNADAPQGALLPGSQNIACSTAATNYALNPPSPTNVNLLGGVVAAPQRHGVASLIVQAGMVSAGATIRLHFLFNVVRFHVQVRTSTGALKMAVTDTFTLDNDDVLITFAAGGASDLVATDVVHVEAWSA